MPRGQVRETAVWEGKKATPLSSPLQEANARGEKGTARKRRTRMMTVRTKEMMMMRKKSLGERK